MSIFNVDKNSQDRGSPRPNTHDVLPQRPNHGTISTQYQSTPQSATNGFVKMQNQAIIANDGNTNIASFGYNKALNKWGIYTTQDVTDVTTNTDLSKFTFNSNQDTFKIVLTGTGSIPSSATDSSTLTIAHGLSTIPFVMAAAYVTSFYNPLPIVAFSLSTGAISSVYSCYADATNAYFNVQVLSGQTVGNATSIRYYILQETAN